jgi:Flp pilus assembly protein TadD
VLANRAVLHYELGNLTEALQDLDRAIILSPNNPELYENRAIALTALEKVTDSQIC